ncbi:hypothetical protein XGA_2611, partial [Xanthomonas hortorum ATCC 19865]
MQTVLTGAVTQAGFIQAAIARELRREGIVVGVDDVLAAAAAQIGGFTYRFEAFEMRR